MKIAIGSDHRGFSLKEKLIAFLQEKEFEVADLGTHTKDSCDYPDVAARVASGVSGGAFDRGVLICGTGIGMSIAANKIKGIRAARCLSVKDARLSREHNDANVLALGAGETSAKAARDIVNVWLAAEPEGGRHKRRIRKIAQLEKGPNRKSG